MTAVEVLDACRGVGVVLAEEGGRLRYQAPPGALTADLRAQILAHREALLALLVEGTNQVSNGETAQADRQASTPSWDVAKADAALAACNARLARARALGGEADNPARRRAVDDYRKAIANLHATRDPLLWQALRELEEGVLARWRSAPGGHFGSGELTERGGPARR